MHYFDYIYHSAAPWPLVGLFGSAVLVLVFWTIAWKGYALWIAARNQHKWWFVALLLINTAGILEIIYIFAVGKPKLGKSAGASSSAGQ